MTDYLTNYSSWDPSKKSLTYIDKRINSDKYRGMVSSQHNRYDTDTICAVLELMEQFAPNKSLMKIRNTDISKRPYNTPDEATYAQFVHEVNKTIGRGSQDSIRKNFFPDFDRGKLIARYTKDRTRLDPWTRGSTR